MKSSFPYRTIRIRPPVLRWHAPGLIWFINVSLMIVCYMSSARAATPKTKSFKATSEVMETTSSHRLYAGVDMPVQQTNGGGQTRHDAKEAVPDDLFAAPKSDDRLVAEKGGVGTAIYSSGAKMVPPFVAAKVAVVLGPEKVARLSETLPIDRAVEITKRLDRKFLMEVTRFLDPEKASSIVEECPDELLVDMTKRLLENEDYPVIAGIADYLSPEKLRIVADGLTARENVRVAGFMKNRALIGSIVVTFSDDYLTELIQASTDLNSFQLAGGVVEEMDINRLVDMLNTLSHIDFQVDRFLTSILPFISPETCAKIVEMSPEETLVTLTQGLLSRSEHALLATISDVMSQEKLKTLAMKLPVKDNIQVASHMKNRQLISRVIAEFPDDYLIDLMKESVRLKNYRLAAEVIQEMDKVRVVTLMDKLSASGFPLDGFLKQAIRHMTPGTISGIVDMSSDQTLVSVINDLTAKNEYPVLAAMADHLSLTKLTTLANKLSPADNINVAASMQNKRLITGVIAGFSDEYVIDLMKESDRMKRFQLAAEVIEEIDNKRLARILARVSRTTFPLDSFMTELAVYMDPGKIAELLETTP